MNPKITTGSEASQVKANLPEWYESPEAQIEKMKQFIKKYSKDAFSARDIPPPPTADLRDGEVYLLICYLPKKGRKGELERTMTAYFDAMEPPEGYPKTKWDEAKFDARHLKQVDGYEWQPGIRWVTFNPDTYQGRSPNRALEASRDSECALAGVEVLAAVYQFRQWPKSWDGVKSPRPRLASLRANVLGGTDWSSVLSLNLWDDGHGHGLHLSADNVDSSSDVWACPGFREI
ncbi:MAG: hypothetical protein LBG75_01560 [Candidatus Nomurabacteria bacterium]|jgi:hypothetical protein|nr:hypothetical protein [Candidatus Nomurabacteria bacterium]